MAFLVTARSVVGEWLSLVEHLVRDQGVGGSNPLSPTNLFLGQVARLSVFSFPVPEQWAPSSCVLCKGGYDAACSIGLNAKNEATGHPLCW
jgi:hypothetical protein